MRELIALFAALALVAKTQGQYNYDEAIRKSILFYEAERSGWLPDNNRISWRSNSATNDRGDNGEDLVGGWYDAGDHVKFGFPMAWTTTTLAWGVVEYREGYKAAGELEWALESIKWPLDYFIKCHASDNEFYGQVGNGHDDHAFWGRPEDMTMARPAYKLTPSAPGSDLAAETAAAMAAGSIAFRESDPSYADRLLDHARRLYEFADNHRGRYSDSITNAQDFYGSTGYEDELAWGALWLARATGDASYTVRAEEFMDEGTAWAYSWDSKLVGTQLLMCQQTGDARYCNAVEEFIRTYLPGGDVQQTPQGLAWRDEWGPLRYSANAAFIALVAADSGIIPGEGRNFARQQIHYMLGDTGRSYVVGFGNNPPQRPHHRAASCPWRPAPCNWNDFNNPGPNPHVLEGALVGGPGQYDDYDDRRDDYIKNEVANDYNAGFQGALAGLKQATIQPSPSVTAPPEPTNPGSNPVTNPATGSPTTTTPAQGQYNYDEAIRKSILFYEAERSGWLPGNNRVYWRGNSATNDRGDNGVDLVGGWYDAGDHVKFGFPMAWTTTTLAWGLIEYRSAYEAAGELNWALESIKWPLDYFIKCHVSDNEFYGQVGNGHEDHGFWGRPEDMTMWRPAYKVTTWAPGSDLAAETAAAMAAGSIVFRQTDPAYADRLLDHARRLYEFAANYRGRYSDSITNAQDFYGSTGYNDELAWGALWLARATGEASYRQRAEEFMDVNTAWAFSWDSKNVGAQLLMYQQAGDRRYGNAVESFIRSYMPGGGVQQTPQGLAWRDQWGPLRYSASASFIALVAADSGIIPGEGRNFARQQIHYMLGDTGRSYVVGFGNNPPQRPHHRAASCPWRPAPCNWNDFNNPGPNPQVLEGALVGGPGQYDDYEDRRDDYIKNEVANDYNAGYQGALAGLKQALMNGNL